MSATGNVSSLTAMIAVAALASMSSAAQARSFPPAISVADEGGPEVVTGQWNYSGAVIREHFVEPVAALANVSRYVAGDYSDWVPADEQILGRLDGTSMTPPIPYAVRIPIRPKGASVDVDNDGEVDAGIQVYAFLVGSNLTGDSYLEQLDQVSYRSYLADPKTGRFREGTLLVFAPDGEQGFPSGAGQDGVFFTTDDPVAGLPAGYTLVTLGRDGTVTFDRSRTVTMNTLEEAFQASPDFSKQGILQSFNSLIDLLKVRYAYTELRKLDWERIRKEYLPRVTAADRTRDFADYYLALTELAISIRDAHVQTDTSDGALKGSYTLMLGKRFAADLGAQGAELSDGRYVITYVVPEGPADSAGWKLGTEIVSIDGEPMAERIGRLPLSGPVGTPEAARLQQLGLALTFPSGAQVTVGYRQPGESTLRTATLAAVEGLSYPQTVAEREPIAFRELEGGYGYVTWFLFRDPQYMIAAWERFLREFQGAPGMVIDLRGNGGGNAELFYTMASYFFSKDKPARYDWIDSYVFDDAAGDLVKEFSVGAPLYAPKPSLRYDGAVVVLVDQHSASAGEYFPQFLQYHHRALVVGEHTTEGAGGYLEQIAMPGNIRFTYTKGRTNFSGTDEANVEAKGVSLDVRVPVTEENERAKLEGRDPVLETAIEVLAGEAIEIRRSRLAGTTWTLQRILAAPGSAAQPDTPAGYTLALAGDGTMDIVTDCNRSKATYELGEGSALKITPTISTLAACPGDSLGDEFLAWLGAAQTLMVSAEGLLVLTDPKSGVLGLMFAPAP